MDKRQITDTIVIHCTQTPKDMDIDVAKVTEWHTQRGFDTIGYHYLIKRDYGDWFARTMSAYSIEEKEALKLVYITTRLKRNLRDDISGYLTAGAQHLMKEGFVPLYIIDRLKNYGLSFDQIWERVTNRADLMNTTILDRLIKKTNALQYNDRIGKLREMALTRGFQLD